MTEQQINNMTKKELEAFLWNDGEPRICRESGCYYKTASGYTLCVGHIHDFPQKAADGLVLAKKRLSLMNP